MSRRLFYCIRPALLAAALLFPAASPVRGRDLVELIPHLVLTENYNDNIQFSPRDTLKDFYLQASPGLSLRLNLPLLPIEADYTYTRYQYRRQSQFNRDYHYFSIRTLQGLQVMRNLTVTVQDKYELIPADVTLPEDQPDNLTQRNAFSVSPVWESRISRKLKLALGYEFSRVDYTSSQFQGDNYYGQRLFNRLNYEIDRSLVCFQRNSYRIKDFSSNPTYSQFLPEAGLELGLGKRVSLAAAGGYSYEDAGGERYGGYVYSFLGSWAATPKLELEAEFRRKLTVDIQGEPYTERYYGVLLRYLPAKKLELESYARYYHETIRGDDFQRIGLKAGLIYRLNRWGSLNGGYLRYQNVDMPAEKSAAANRVYVGVNLSY